ncbi:MAG: hypothetical protein IKJ19_02780 [Clostridia bacterium]|nr:hypothetical protein [Clostridia bacterium]
MKTKKLLLIILSLIMVVSTSLFVACKPDNQTATLESIEYLSGLGAAAYEKGEDLDLSKLKIKANYSDGTSKEISYTAEDFTVTYDSDIDEYSSTATVTIEYQGKTCIKTVVFSERYQISGVAYTPSYADYLVASGQSKDEQGQDVPSIFTVSAETYKVGDDNAFSVRPVVSGLDITVWATINDIKNIPFIITVEKWVDESYVVMENPSTDVVIDQDLATVDFEESAIGNKYRVSVYPEKLSPAQMNSLSEFTTVLELEVVEGYNVYDLLGLSLIDNTINNDNSKGDDWKAMRHAAGLTVDSNTISGIVLHANIAVTPEGIPSSFLFNDGDSDLNPSDADYARAKGSLRDYAYILRRNLQPNQHFDIHGNYFNVNASALPLVVRPNNKPVEEGATVIPHSSLLWIGCNDTQEVCNATEATINNLNAIGNLQLLTTDTTGGIIFFKSAQQKVLLNNLVARQWYITAFPQLQDSAEYAMTIKDNQYYDNYNSFVYNWGSYVNIENSVMKTCGGPVIIADNCNHGVGQTTELHPLGWVPVVNVDDDSVLESWVSGGESWFVQMNANNQAETIKLMDGFFNAQGSKSFITDGKMNLVLVMKSGSAEAITNVKISGSFNVGDFVLNMDHPIVAGGGGRGALFLGSSLTEMATVYQVPNTETQYLVDVQKYSAGDQSPIGSTHGVFTGDYLGILLGDLSGGTGGGGYMGIVLGGYRPLG